MLDSFRLHLYSLVRASRFRLLQTRPPAYGSTKVLAPDAIAGPAPLRVLLVGAGVLAGYGVADHTDAVAGPLAAQLARSLSRSVVVDCRVSPMLPLREAVSFIGPNGSHTYDAVVFAPCFLEGQFAPTPLTKRRLEDVIRHLTITGRKGLVLVLLALPEPTGSSRFDLAVADAARRSAQIMLGVMGDLSLTRTAAAPAFGSVNESAPFGVEYYRRAAAVLAGSLAPLLSSASSPALG